MESFMTIQSTLFRVEGKVVGLRGDAFGCRRPGRLQSRCSSASRRKLISHTSAWVAEAEFKQMGDDLEAK